MQGGAHLSRRFSLAGKWEPASYKIYKKHSMGKLNFYRLCYRSIGELHGRTFLRPIRTKDAAVAGPRLQ